MRSSRSCARRLDVVRRESMRHQEAQAQAQAAVAATPGFVGSARGAPRESDAGFSGSFGGSFGFAASAVATAGVEAVHRACYEDDAFLADCEKAVHFRPKSRTHDFKNRIEEYNEALKSLKTCVQQLFKRKDKFYNDCVALEREREQGVESMKLQVESANASAAAAEGEVKSLKSALESQRASANAEAAELRADLDHFQRELKLESARAEAAKKRAEEESAAHKADLDAANRRCAALQEEKAAAVARGGPWHFAPGIPVEPMQVRLADVPPVSKSTL